MKKFLTATLLFVTVAVTALPISSVSASVQTVECSWWGKAVNGEYDSEATRQAELQRQQEEEMRRQEEMQRQEEERRQQEEEYYYRQQQQRRRR